MATETCPPCTHNCRQGRDCPARKKTMPAPTDLAETILRDVPRYTCLSAYGPPDQFMEEADVLAALSTALDAPELIFVDNYRETPEGRVGVWGEAKHVNGGTPYIRADLAPDPALRAELDWWKQDDRIEALVKERDEALEWLSASQGYIADAVFALDKQEKAEARAERLEAALREIAAEASVPVRTKKKKGGIKHKWMYRAWRKIAVDRIDIARAALKGDDHE